MLLIGALFAADVSGGQVEILSIDVSPTALFLLGLVSGACLLLGLWISKFGARRELRQRKERKQLDELSDKLDRAGAERRRDLDEDRP